VSSLTLYPSLISKFYFFSTSVNPSSQVSSAPGQPQRLNAYKVNVVNAVDANLFIVFANKRIGDEVKIFEIFFLI